ncbi:hypothetical protein GCM10029978_088650 [Actinoallomurus acanthiterrae]
MLLALAVAGTAVLGTTPAASAATPPSATAARPGVPYRFTNGMKTKYWTCGAQSRAFPKGSYAKTLRSLYGQACVVRTKDGHKAKSVIILTNKGAKRIRNGFEALPALSIGGEHYCAINGVAGKSAVACDGDTVRIVCKRPYAKAGLSVDDEDHGIVKNSRRVTGHCSR